MEAASRSPAPLPYDRSIVELNVGSCQRVADWLSRVEIPPDEEEQRFSVSAEMASRFYFLLVAICHQTSPIGKPRLQGRVNDELLFGWDYLAAKLAKAVQTDASWLDPSRWSALTSGELADLYTDSVEGLTLSDLPGRAALINDLGYHLQSLGWSGPDDLLRVSEGWVAVGPHNLLSLLAEFKAYRDPVRKKSCFFLSLARNSGAWELRDPEAIGPPVDYHEVRGHLRIGTVVVKSNELLAKLTSGSRVSGAEDVAIRSAVYDAILLICDLAHIQSPSALHYLFWNVFRTACLRDTPHCRTPFALPERYQQLPSDTLGCPFASLCGSSDLTERLLEHAFDTDYY